MIAALKRELAQQLRQKDRSIREIQEGLSAISREREKFRGGMQAALQRYRNALSLLLENQQLMERVTEQIMNIGFRLLAAGQLSGVAVLKSHEARRAGPLARLRELKERYLAYVQLEPSSSTGEDTP